MLSGENSILKRAVDAKERTERTQEEEAANLTFTTTQMELSQGKSVDGDTFQTIIDSNFGTGNAKGSVGGKKYIITVKRSGVNYQMDSKGNISTLSELPIDFEPGVLEKNGDTYIINSIEDLVALSYNVNSGKNLYENCVVQLGKNLNFEEDNSYANPSAKYSKDSYGYIPDSSSETTIKDYMINKKGNGFVPIGTGISTFKGNFSGNGKSLINLYVNANSFGGLFGQFNSNVIIERLSIISCDIKGTSPTGAIVGLGGYSGKLQIEGCNVVGNIATSSNGGGLVGNASNLTIYDSSYSGDLTGTPVGGMVGICETLNLSNCCNKSGTITAQSIGGGLVGKCSNITISYCYNKANINGGTSAPIGGIVGNGSGIIDNCYNSGKVSLGNVEGGIIGDGNNNIEIVNCYNSGEISSNGLTAGIIGNGPKSILNCYNFNSVTSTRSQAGGIVANVNENETIEYCYNSGSITSSSSPIGGISGFRGTIKNCYNTGLINSPNEHMAGYIIGSGSVENTNFYLKNSSSIVLPNGATEKTESEMNQIMNIQSFCNLMNDYNRKAYGVNMGLWTIGSDGLPNFGLE